MLSWHDMLCYDTDNLNTYKYTMMWDGHIQMLWSYVETCELLIGAWWTSEDSAS